MFLLRERVGPDLPLSPSQLNSLLGGVGGGPSDGNGRDNEVSSPMHPQLPPIQQPLALRFRDYYQRSREASSAGTGRPNFQPIPAIDRFRDVPPAMVLALFEGSVAVIEPGSVGPLPLGHPVVVELMECINGRYVTPNIMTILLGTKEDGTSGDAAADSDGDADNDGDDAVGDPLGSAISSKLYDGGLVVAILDYRKTCSFASVSGSHLANTANVGIPSGTSQGLLSTMSTQGIAPEMHKVFLRPSYASMAPFMGECDEAELVRALHPSLLLDPSPSCWQAIEWALYDRDKFAVHCAEWMDFASLYPCTWQSARTLSAATAATALAGTPAVVESLPPLNKLKQLSALEEAKTRRAAGAAEAFLGIDQRRNLSRTRSPLPTTVMNNPSQRVWRTVRFERDHEPASSSSAGPKKKKSHYSVNIVALPSGVFEVILRMGDVPDTAQGPHGFTQRFTLPSLPAVEVYLTHLKHLFSLEDVHRKLTVDVANPAVLTGSSSYAGAIGGMHQLGKTAGGGALSSSSASMPSYLLSMFPSPRSLK